MNENYIEYIEADETWKDHIAAEWSEKAARHMHIQDGFSILALQDGNPVGLISVYWKKLPLPLANTIEGYIDIIEVITGYRRQGIARRLVELSVEKAKKCGAYQLRAWSSEDKKEAIPMWKRLGFGLHPAKIPSQSVEINGYLVTRVL